MEELVVTRYWMAGVMAIMIIFGAISVVGIFVRNKREGAASGSDTQEE